MNIDLASTGSLERPADLIRQQHPSLDTMLCRLLKASKPEPSHSVG